MTGEDWIRIEHKLDAILYMLQEQGGIVRDLPKPVPGTGGMTDGLCPISHTPIFYKFQDGDLVRVDGCKTGLVTTGKMSATPVVNSSFVLSGNGGGNSE